MCVCMYVAMGLSTELFFLFTGNGGKRTGKTGFGSVVIGLRASICIFSAGFFVP